ncbi:hypothetical protein [Pantoea sp. OXWO6B1]|uniref:hypothetical protein n=1 Tax=Pantoea sp. OXWO6B1 TaxID=1835724 RepID=UPI0007C791B5|nr:hypothetical protein [Pantoea sp. OXWO6B1]OAD98022.1 hypothetical protein A6A26_24060 [Pantoea sp. OXWO6B1]
MKRNLISEKIQREILIALAKAYPDPITGRQYFSAFGMYSEYILNENIDALIQGGLVSKTAIGICGGVNFQKLVLLRLDFDKYTK